MRQSEHVLYITLIDFLLQLLFLGLVISVIYAIDQAEQNSKSDPAKARDAIESMKRIKTLTGISDITILTDQLTRLSPLQAASRYTSLGRNLEPYVDQLGGVEIAKKILADSVKKGVGQGKPSCLPNGAKLGTFHLYPDRIELPATLTKEMTDLLKRTAISVSESSRLSLSEFKSLFSPVVQLNPDCRFNVEIIEHSYDTRPRDAVRSAFAVMWLTVSPDRK